MDQHAIAQSLGADTRDSHHSSETFSLLIHPSARSIKKSLVRHLQLSARLVNICEECGRYKHNRP